VKPALKQPIRVGVIRDFFYENATPEARSLQDQFLEKLSRASRFQVAEARLPAAFKLSQAILRTILRADVASVHEKLFPEHPTAYGPILRQLIETGMLVGADDYLRARRLRKFFQREMSQLFNSFDVLLTPAAPGPAPEGIAATALETWCRRSRPGDGLRCFVAPFLPQDQYDLLLWACDVNFVRGEDSFVRAQWAARPFVWHIYPTEDNAHWVKLAAFLARYTAGLERAHAGAVTALWEAWNRRDGAPSRDAETQAFPGAWAEFAGRREALEAHAGKWAAGLALRRDLAAAIVDFVDNLL